MASFILLKSSMNITHCGVNSIRKSPDAFWKWLSFEVIFEKIRDGKILNSFDAFFCEHKKPDFSIDCQKSIISPGFIDLQINGGWGTDFSEDTTDLADGIKNVGKKLLETGVTAFCPTIISSRKEIYAEISSKIERTECSPDGASVLGLHLEGPFINPERKGAHHFDNLSQYNNGIKDVIDMYKRLDNVSIITLAPELERSSEVIETLTKEYNICVSLGHSAANLIQGEDAFNSGARSITHLFNAMLPFHHRDPHLVGLLTSSRVKQPVYYGIIADGIHTHPSALRIAWRAAPNGLILITDAVSAFGLGPGNYLLGGQSITVKNNRATIASTDTLCGSIASIPQCIYNLSKSARCSLAVAIETATSHPASLLGIPKGQLKNGYDADIVMLDETENGLKVLSTFTKGIPAFCDRTWHFKVREH